MKQTPVKQRTRIDCSSRRSHTLSYHLPKDGSPASVCKVMFLTTLNISEKTMRTALSKLQECHCYTWHEGLAKRGATEIGTCLKMYLEHVDKQGKNEVILFADGCVGENKNSIIETMLLNLVNKLENAQSISLSLSLLL